MASAYNQIPLDSSSKECTTINTPFGLYRYNRLPFGLKSAPAIFQETIDKVLTGIPKTFAYLDDIVVAGETIEEHRALLEQVFERLKNTEYN